jgi:hypothetical protein
MDCNNNFIADGDGNDANILADGDLIDILNLTQPVQELGPDLQNDVALSINRLYSQKVSKETLDNLKVKYKIPNNCKWMGVPKINSEIWPLLPQRNRQNDYNQQVNQQSIALTSTINAKIAEKLFTTTET